MDVDVVDDCETFVSVVCSHRPSFWCVAHFSDVHREALARQLESVGVGEFHL